jgi:hypothetical protein
MTRDPPNMEITKYVSMTGTQQLLVHADYVSFLDGNINPIKRSTEALLDAS